MFQGFSYNLDFDVGFTDAGLGRLLLRFEISNALFGNPQLFNCPLSDRSGVLFCFVRAILDIPNCFGRLKHKVKRGSPVTRVCYPRNTLKVIAPFDRI